MKQFTAVIEKCAETGMFVGYIPSLPGAYTQGETLAELRENLVEVIELILEEGESVVENEFVGTELVEVN